MFGRDKQDQTFQTQATDNTQDDSTKPPVFVPEPEHLDSEDTSIQESVDAVMSHEQPAAPAADEPAPQASGAPTTSSEPNFIMTSTPDPAQTTTQDEPEEVETETQTEPEPEVEVEEDEPENNFAVPVNVNKSQPTESNSPDLAIIKNEALKSLAPLVDHLDQSPEEKFQTVMMMLDASNDRALVKSAYEAAKEINDEKARSKALLEVVAKIDSLS